MQLVKLITPKRINTLHCFSLTIFLLLFTAFSPAFSQDNSPYSRYGIGDLVPSTNIISRGIGGVSAGYIDYLSINFNNPASYSFFQADKEEKSNRIRSARALLDVGINFENRTLKEPATAKSFSASNALFSHVQIGIPLKKGWGLSFGLRPISRISYKIDSYERLKDPQTGLPIDTAVTRYQGDGGAYLVSAGTGIVLFKKSKLNSPDQTLSLGITGGYLFGEKDYSTRRSFLNDTVQYYQANFETKTNYGGLYLDAGLQYVLPFNSIYLFSLGAYGHLGHNLNATQDLLRETFISDPSQGNLRLDSVSETLGIKGELKMPSSFTVGFVIQKLLVPNKSGGWLFGMDFIQQNWSQYRFYGETDRVRNKWELRMGAELKPMPRRSLFTTTYRAGFFVGNDYIQVGNKLPIYGGSLGIGVPLLSGQARNQVTYINLAFEYSKRGNNNNLLSENMFRLSLGLSLSDIWFIKRRYD